ncbi:MAG: T9SS type A sorting domain-containing protein [Bacteroidetes bacterium]|nr:T9SS type A sorting domain-containing protein [Bacteroidota bacterium]
MKKLLLLISFVFCTMCINAQSLSFGFDSTMFIPDGPNCLPGVLNASVIVNNFPANSTILSATNIMSICVNIEHSYSGDLGFKLFCPNGQSVVLDGNSHSGGNYLGIPNGNDGTPACDSYTNPPGIGWNYCWSEISPYNFTLNQLSVDTAGVGTTLIGTKRRIDSTNQITHTNYLKPENYLSALVGCPLNGIWSMQITDDYAMDNGYIFGWNVKTSFLYVIPPTPVITLIGDTLFSDAPLGNQWYNLATGAIAGATAVKYLPLQTGDYFTIVSINGQTSDSSNIIHYIHTGIETTTANRFHVKVTPNPFTASTNIKYYLSEPSQVSLIIMDITGKEIQKTVSEKQAKGEQSITFTANSYPSGLYFYKLTINDTITVGKLLLNN